MPGTWYQNSVIYAVCVERFQDTNGDGIGDVEGVRRQLPYIADLGVDCVWLLPFYRSPMRDQGYDVSDHQSVASRYGTIGDVRQLIREADELGIRIVVDLVVNHTSDDHRWFVAACRDPSSRFHDYYVWTDDPDAAPSPDPVMPPVQQQVWTVIEDLGEWYLHHFFSHEPDLNTNNPAVFQELLDVVAFWLDQGVRGFRIDAAPYAVAKAGGISDGKFQTDAGHWFLQQLRSFADARSPNSTFMFAEANVPPEDQNSFFGVDEPEIHGLYNFTSNQHLFLSLADRSAEPLRRGLRRISERPSWAVDVNWVRNLDELDLKQLTDDERQRLFDRFDPEDDSRLFNGIVHRAPALLGRGALLRLAYSVAFALPGIPLLSYGEEIALGDDLSQPGRQAVRPPMQWSTDRHAGFCSADVAPEQPVLADTGGTSTNVAEQRHDPDSLLRWMRRLISVRHQCAAIGAGRCEVIDTDDEAVLALTYRLDTTRVIVLHNFAERAATVDSSLLKGVVHGRELLSDKPYGPLVSAHDVLDVGPLGYRWITGEDEA